VYQPKRKNEMALGVIRGLLNARRGVFFKGAHPTFGEGKGRVRAKKKGSEGAALEKTSFYTHLEERSETTETRERGKSLRKKNGMYPRVN